MWHAKRKSAKYDKGTNRKNNYRTRPLITPTDNSGLNSAAADSRLALQW